MSWDASAIPPELRAAMEAVEAKRARTVIDHLMQHGKISTNALLTLYGYAHAPRAARDVREQGIPLKTTKERGPDGRSMAVYVLDLEAVANLGKAGGRRAFPKAFKDALVARYGEQCNLCGAKFPARALQIDHRVPYEVGGDAAGELKVDEHMLVCAPCNRQKSWSCEHCTNWLELHDMSICGRCYWASPEQYEHVAMQQQRRLAVAWDGDEVSEYDAFSSAASEHGASVSDFLKRLVRTWTQRQK